MTWFFGRGPRQTIALDATLDAALTPRLMGWTATLDELADLEQQVRGLAGGVGAVVHRANDGATPPRVTPEDRIVRGLTAGTFQHEVDHLDGLLFVDRVVDTKSLCTWSEFERYHYAAFAARARELVAKYGG